MKILYVFLGIFLVSFLIFQVFILRSQNNIETYSYVVEKSYEKFEIRTYNSTLFTSVKLTTNDFKVASSKGFSILAGYIFGGNDRNEKIAMTSPVTMSLEDSMTMMFMVPKKFTKETLPEPTQSKIKIIEQPERSVAAVSFGGWANTEKIEKFKKALKSALEKENIAHTDRFYFFGYNAPYELFNRKNEIIVELK
jgi:hypothetical protein